MLLYGVDVHVYFPATIDSAHLARENETKPAITLKIEESDPIAQPDACAAGLLRGVQRGDFNITDTFNGDAFRTNTRGSTPWNGIIKDTIYGVIGFVSTPRGAICIRMLTCVQIGIPLWRMGVDRTVRKHSEEHQRYLSERGFFQ